MNRGYYGGPLQPSLVRAGMFINAKVHTRTEPARRGPSRGPIASHMCPAARVERVVSRPNYGDLAGDKAARNAAKLGG